MRYVIIGNGIAGWSAAKAIRTVDGSGQVLLLSEDEAPTYSRVLLGDYVAGRVSREALFLAAPEAVEGLGIEVRLGERAIEVSPRARRVALAGGGSVPFDRLLLATGAAPVVPTRIPPGTPGVFPLRGLADADAIRRAASAGREGVVWGGGFVGLKAAKALRDTGMRVHLVVSSDRVLSRVVGQVAGELLRRRLEAHGVRVHLEEDVAEAIAAGGKLGAVRLRGGGLLECSLLVLAKGVQPNMDLAIGSGLATGRGILVDTLLQTSCQTIYAAGDVAEAYDPSSEEFRVNAIWPNAVAQGTAAGRNMAGRREAARAGVAFNAVDLFGLPAVNVGVSDPPEGGPYRVLERRCGPVYRRLVWNGERLSGALLVGDIQAAGVFRALIARATPVGRWQEGLMDPSFNYGRLYGWMRGEERSRA